MTITVAEMHVTKDEVLEAYNRLFDAAARGEHMIKETLEGRQPETRRSNGIRFDRTVEVLDVVDGQTVEGVATLLLIAKHAIGEWSSSLVVEAALRWTTSDGVQHLSTSYYDISAAALGKLANSAEKPVLGHRLIEAAKHPKVLKVMKALSLLLLPVIVYYVFRSLFRAKPYHTTWEQTPNIHTDRKAGRITRAEANAIGLYHAKAIQAVQQDRPMTCPLSGSPTGAVLPAEFVVLADWLGEQVCL